MNLGQHGMSAELIRGPVRRVPVGLLLKHVMSSVLPQRIVMSKGTNVVMNAPRLGVVVRRRTDLRRVLRAEDQIAHLPRKRLMQVASQLHPMMNTGMNSRAGCGTTRRRRNQRLHLYHGRWPQILTRKRMTLKKSLRRLLRPARTATTKMRHRVDAGGAVAVGDADAVVAMKRKRQPRQVTPQIPRVARWTLMMTSARSCSKRIRKISSVFHLAA